MLLAYSTAGMALLIFTENNSIYQRKKACQATKTTKSASFFALFKNINLTTSMNDTFNVSVQLIVSGNHRKC